MKWRYPDLKIYIRESSRTNKRTLVGVSVFHSLSLIPSLGRPVVFISHTLSKAERNHVSFSSIPRGVSQQVGSHDLSRSLQRLLGKLLGCKYFITGSKLAEPRELMINLFGVKMG